MTDEKAAPLQEVTPGGDKICVWKNEHVRVHIGYGDGVILVGVESAPIDGTNGPWFTSYSSRGVHIVPADEDERDALRAEIADLQRRLFKSTEREAS